MFDARSNHRVVFRVLVEYRTHFGDHVQTVGEIAVGEDDQVALPLEHSLPDGVALAAVGLIGDAANVVGTDLVQDLF